MILNFYFSFDFCFRSYFKYQFPDASFIWFVLLLPSFILTYVWDYWTLNFCLVLHFTNHFNFYFYFYMNFLQDLKNFKFKLISPFFFESQDEANHSSSLKCPPKSSPHIDELSHILMSTWRIKILKEIRIANLPWVSLFWMRRVKYTKSNAKYAHLSKGSNKKNSKTWQLVKTPRP